MCGYEWEEPDAQDHQRPCEGYHACVLDKGHGDEHECECGLCQ